MCLSVYKLDLTAVSEALSIQNCPEERDAVEGLVLPEHVLGCHSPVLVCQLPVANVGRVTDQREREASNVSPSKHILTCLHKLGRGGGSVGGERRGGRRGGQERGEEGRTGEGRGGEDRRGERRGGQERGGQERGEEGRGEEERGGEGKSSESQDRKNIYEHNEQVTTA